MRKNRQHTKENIMVWLIKCVTQKLLDLEGQGRSNAHTILLGQR